MRSRNVEFTHEQFLMLSQKALDFSVILRKLNHSFLVVLFFNSSLKEEIVDGLLLKDQSLLFKVSIGVSLDGLDVLDLFNLQCLMDLHALEKLLP